MTGKKSWEKNDLWYIFISLRWGLYILQKENFEKIQIFENNSTCPVIYQKCGFPKTSLVVHVSWSCNMAYSCHGRVEAILLQIFCFSYHSRLRKCQTLFELYNQVLGREIIIRPAVAQNIRRVIKIR